MDEYSTLIEQHIGLGKYIVRSFRPRSKQEYDELLQASRIGIWNALVKHKPEKGRFTTIAYRSIVWEILAEIKKHNRFYNKHKTDYDERLYSPKQELWEILPDYLTDDERVVITLLVHNNKTDTYKTLGISQTKFNGILQEAIRKIQRANR